MRIDPNNQTVEDNYKLLIGAVVPRPIAFVTSQNAEGLVNAAPFSFFNTICAAPPLICVSVNRKPGGQMKDTSANITKAKEFVVHVVDESNIESVNFSSMDFPPNYSEVNEAGLTLQPSHVVKVPGIRESKIRMECVLHRWIPLGDDESPSSDLIIGEVVCFDIQDDLYVDGKIPAEKLRPVGRMAGTMFTKLGETFSIPRPKFRDR
ncbi:MAG TPA: flavin reductase family protein [Bacillales bacterium]|nr:flavin reductase family protein [Bacillales bacterium]